MRRWIWESEPKTDLLAEALAETRTALGLDDQDPWAHLTHGNGPVANEAPRRGRTGLPPSG